MCAVLCLQDAALSIAAITRDAGLECDDEAYLDTFRPTLMDVFYHWSLGESFAAVGRQHAAWLRRREGVFSGPASSPVCSCGVCACLHGVFLFLIIYLCFLFLSILSCLSCHLMRT